MSRVTGNINLQQAFSRLSSEVQTKVKEIVEVNTGDMEMEAIRNAPGAGDMIATQHGSENERDIVGDRNWTPISQAIGYTITQNGLKGSVFVEKSAGDIAAWVEFSTGQTARTYLATVPKKWRDLARKFYINGRGTIIGKPYLLPAFMKYSVIFQKELKDLLKNITLR